MPKNRLFIDEIMSVGAVTEGDDPEAEITFWKRREQKPSITRKQSHQMVTMRKGDRMVEFDFEGFSDEQKDAVEAAIGELQETIANLETPVEPEPDIVKSADPELQELIAKQQADLEDALAVIAKERQIRRDAEFLTKAEGLAAVLGKPEEWAPILEQLEAGAPEAYAALETQLSVAKNQIETGELFKELGKSAEGTDKLSALVKAKRDLNPSMTAAQARVEVWLENPDLVEESRAY